MILSTIKKSLKSKPSIDKLKIFIANIRKFGGKYLFFKFVLTYFNYYRIKGNFLNFKTTLDYIRESNKSLIRLGDGEIRLILGKSIDYQKYDYNLEQDLIKIIKNYKHDSPYFLALATDYIQATNKQLKDVNRPDLWVPLKIMYKTIFPKECVYGNVSIFRYIDYFSIDLKFLYEDKTVIFVANENVIELANLKKSKKIIKIVPKTQRNSYFQKDEIMNQIYESMIQFEKSEVVILLSCGPLAKVLTYEISAHGYRALDLGYMFEAVNIHKKIKEYYDLTKHLIVK